MAFNLVEAEGLQDVWDLEPEPPAPQRAFIFPEQERSSNDYINEPDAWLCWRGTRFPQWM
jgi:hypothetical protein